MFEHAYFAAHVDATRTLVVNGKYRAIRDSLTDSDELLEPVRYLVARESGS